MTLSAGESYSGGQVRDSQMRAVVISETTDSAISAGALFSGGRLRDADGRMVICQDTAHAVLTATEQYSGGEVLDRVGRLACAAETVNTALSAGSAFSGGFLRDSRGRRIIALDTLGAALSAGEQFSGGQVRDSIGRLVLATETAGSVYNAAVLADTPVGFWPLNDPSGTVAADLSGNGHPGAYTGGFTLAQPGPCSDGQASVVLNGSTGYVAVPASAALRPALVTAECWVYVTTTANTGFICSNAFTSNIGYELGNDCSGAGGTQIARFAGGWAACSAGSALSLNAWHHVAGTYDGTNLNTYIDGVAVGSPVSSGALAYDVAEFRIGQRHDAFNGLTGRIAKAAVYNTALSAGRIAAHYAAR